MEKKPKIAIIDDDAEIRASLIDLMTDNGFEAAAFEGGSDFAESLSQGNLALAVIDLKLRGESGLALAQQIRITHDLPIVMLTGVGDDLDKIVGLEAGADDYIMKPYNPRELVARIRAVLRRYDISKATEPRLPVPPSHSIGFGDFFLDLEKCELSRTTGEKIPLTNAEFRILEFFVSNPNHVITRPELLQTLGSDLDRFLDRTIDVLILRIRRKIEKAPSKPRHLQTRRNAGYIFVAETKQCS
ncbi:response regulator [Roseibium sp. M-1]